MGYTQFTEDQSFPGYKERRKITRNQIKESLPNAKKSKYNCVHTDFYWDNDSAVAL